MCAQQKQVTQMHYHWGQTAKKKEERGYFDQRSGHQAKKQCNLFG